MKKRPNILFILADDHAAHAISAYGSRINHTPNIDRISKGGIRMNNCFCTNSICTPSRASILTGTYNHINGVKTMATHLDNSILTFPELLQDAGYQTGVYGKWHLGEGESHRPRCFDEWAVLPGQGRYHNPHFICKGEPGPIKKIIPGYVTNIITDFCLDFLENRDQEKPFCLLCHHKAPHRAWEPDEKHAHLFADDYIQEPETLYDSYENRSQAAKDAQMRLGVHQNAQDLKCDINYEMPEMELRSWAYQRYIKDYLRVIASIDENVGRLLDFLEQEGIADETIVIYSSDQGFFLGDHGWYDKRFMYEESLRMPLLIKYPDAINSGIESNAMVTNVDFAATILDLCGLSIPETFQGKSMQPILSEAESDDWPDAVYYRYWMHGDIPHNVAAHYGIRTKRFKLICYYGSGLSLPGTSPNDTKLEWELFDLASDPKEMKNLYHDPAYAEAVRELTVLLSKKQEQLGDEPFSSPSAYNTKI